MPSKWMLLNSIKLLRPVIIHTDPPYYDNIGYADLSTFFMFGCGVPYNAFIQIFFPPCLVPKATELVATPYRFGGNKEKAKQFFEEGLKAAFSICEKHPIRTIR